MVRWFTVLIVFGDVQAYLGAALLVAEVPSRRFVSYGLGDFARHRTFLGRQLSGHALSYAADVRDDQTSVGDHAVHPFLAVVAAYPAVGNL